MGRIRNPELALLFISTLFRDNKAFHNSKEILKNSFGEILFISPAIQWDYSLYYKEEIGWPLYRHFIFFKKLIDPGVLADIKLRTNEIEFLFSSEGKRTVNLDPGYLTLSKVVLASTKDYAHRIYLGKGIYGEITLIYKDNSYKPHLFTYKDYQDKTHIDILMKARGMLKKMLV